MCGDFTFVGSARTSSGKEAEAGFAGRFFARREHGLKAETNSENRHAGIVRRAKRRREIAFAQTGDERGEVADAGQNDHFRRSDLLRLDGALGFGAQFSQRALDRRQIARTVIYDGDFHSMLL